MNATFELLKIKIGFTTKPKLLAESEIMDLLGNEFPEINVDLEKLANPNNGYKAVQCFADFTKQLIRKGNFKEVKHCFLVAEKMLQQGNSHVKTAIENVYLFSLSTILDFTNPVSQKVKSLLTISLKEEYNRQTCSSGV